MDRKKIGLMLQGMGAGFQGRLPEFQRGQLLQQAQEQALTEERKQAMLEDAYRVQQALQSGFPPAALDILYDRFDEIRARGGDPSDTLALIKKIETRDPTAMVDVDTLVNYGYTSGRLQLPPSPKTQIVDGQLVTIDQAGAATASAIPGFDTSGADKDRVLRERQIANAEAIEARQANKLSAGLERVLLESQQSSIDRQGDAINFNTIAQEFETRPDQLYGGAVMTVNEAFKALLGNQDDVSELRRKINAIRVAEGIGQLPPGVASDKDIELVMSGQIRENASPEQVASYLRGAAKAAQYAAGYNQMRVDFVNQNRQAAGLNNAWRRALDSPVLGRKVFAAEIYREAMATGKTPQQVMQDFGIEGDLLSMEGLK